MHGLFGSVRITKSDNNIWRAEDAYRANTKFFARRGIRTPEELTNALSLIPGASDLTSDEIVCTYGFSVNFLSRRVSGYALRVSSKAHVKQFYFPEQRETIVCVVSKRNPTVTDTETLSGKLDKLHVDFTADEGMWAMNETQEGESRAETDRRLFFGLISGRRNTTLYLYMKASIPSDVSKSNDTVEKYVQQTKSVSVLVERHMVRAATAFFDDSVFDVEYKVITNTFEQIDSSNYYFLNDVTIVDYSKDTMLLFDNFDKTLLLHRNMDKNQSLPSFSDIFTTATRPLERNKNAISFIGLESPIADARIDTSERTVSKGYDITDLVDHRPEMKKADLDFHVTVSYVEIQFSEHPKELTMKEMTPNTMIIQQGPVYWTQKYSNFSLSDKIRLNTRTQKAWLEMSPDWQAEESGITPLDFALSALKMKNLPITTMKFTETGVRFPTAVLADYENQYKAAADESVETNGV